MSFCHSMPVFLAILLGLALLPGCSQQSNYAPVTVSNQVFANEAGKSTQQPKTTALDNLEPFRDNRFVVKNNSINSEPLNDYAIKGEDNIAYKRPLVTAKRGVNEQLKKSVISKNTPKNLASKPVIALHKPEISISKISIKKEKKPIISTDNKKMLKLDFVWPIKGRISRSFNSSNYKGIDIVGKAGQKVRAAEAGKIAYSGQGLIGLGNLIIIKHNDLFLSAYGNNSLLLVKEGELVEKGQFIAQVGEALSKKAALHFEIRKNGKPVNPLKLLPKSEKKL